MRRRPARGRWPLKARRRCADRAGSDRLQVEVPASQFVAVVLQVRCVKHHGAPGDSEVEHDRGVVGDQQVGDLVQVCDVRVVGDVQQVGVFHRSVGGRDPIVGPEQHRDLIAERPTQAVEVDVPDGGCTAALVGAVANVGAINTTL